MGTSTLYEAASLPAHVTIVVSGMEPLAVAPFNLPIIT